MKSGRPNGITSVSSLLSCRSPLGGGGLTLLSHDGDHVMAGALRLYTESAYICAAVSLIQNRAAYLSHLAVVIVVVVVDSTTPN